MNLMAIMEILNQATVAGFAAVLVWAAVQDLFSLRISNWTTLAVLALYPVYVVSASPMVALPMALAIGGFVFLVGFVLFHFKYFGGGDVKLFADVALWAGAPLVVGFLLTVAVVGGLLAVASMTPLRMLLPYMAAATRIKADMAHLMQLQIPYGVPIAAGGLFVAARLMHL